MGDGRPSTVVEEELCLVEIFLVASDEVELCQRHLGYLMAWHHTCLSFARAYLTTNAVGKADGDVEELAAASGLVVGDGAFYHVAKVIQLVARLFVLHPAAVASPFMGVLRVLGAGGVEVSVRLLGGGYDVDDGVDVVSERLVIASVQQIRCSLDGLVGVGVIERVAADLEHFRGVFHVRGSVLEILVAPRLLTLGKG